MVGCALDDVLMNQHKHKRVTHSLTVLPSPVLTGVIWKGDSVIEGVPETLDTLRSLVRIRLHACAIVYEAQDLHSVKAHIQKHMLAF